ncbi:MAG: zinc-dependent metalloprotease [Phycisphaerales bacterium]
MMRTLFGSILAGSLLLPLSGATALGIGTVAAEDPFPPFAKVSEGFTKVVSTADGEASLYTLYLNPQTNDILAELPRNFTSQRHFFAMTVASGDMWAGLQYPNDRYVYWKRFDKRLALIEPQIGTRSTGDQESRSSVERHFTDTVLLDVPIVCMGPNGGPVIDMDSLLLGNIGTFFGPNGSGANAALSTITEAKAFPQNIEIEIELPVRGVMKGFHYSISNIPNSTGYAPRAADERVGYFTTTYRDLGKFQDDEKWIRYITRWKLEKADPKLRLSPPKEPIVFYVEHTVPVRYRRWVREGVLYWNKAFEQIGITNAIEVHLQDASTGAHMDKDPEDVRYNFVRWLSNDIGTAIGPSRVHPLTGQILDADIVLTDGWIRYFNYQFNDLLPDLATEGFTPETLAWLERNPQWDPRILLAEPAQRDYLLAERASRGVQRYGGHPAAMVDPSILGDDEYDGLIGRVSQVNGLCMAGRAKSMGMSLMRMHMGINQMLTVQDADDDDADEDDAEAGDGEAPKDETPQADLIDGIPDWFIGPMLADLVCHEVGHTLGLRHNFKGSSAYTLAEINSAEFKGKRPMATTVMDYLPANIEFEAGEVQGDYAMIGVGPYDLWAIEYGYTFDDPKKALARVAEPELQYATDEDTSGPDPLARRYDFAADPLDYANNQMRLVKHYREHLLDKFVPEGDSWAKARQGYQITLNEQMGAVSMMSNWIGGAHVYRDHKGDPNGRAPIEVVDPAKQRAALAFIINNMFNDEAFGLTPELLKHLTVQKWLDGEAIGAFQDATWPVHDRIEAMQASAMTMVMNPSTLKRVYDNEFRIPAEQDALTLPEVLGSVVDAVFTELGTELDGETFTNRQPMISSLRRNLQAELVDRLIPLALDEGGLPRPIENLASMHLRTLRKKIDGILEKAGEGQIDAYTQAHLFALGTRIDEAFEAIHVKTSGGRGFNPFLF